MVRGKFKGKKGIPCGSVVKLTLVLSKEKRKNNSYRRDYGVKKSKKSREPYQFTETGPVGTTREGRFGGGVMKKRRKTNESLSQLH